MDASLKRLILALIFLGLPLHEAIRPLAHAVEGSTAWTRWLGRISNAVQELNQAPPSCSAEDRVEQQCRNLDHHLGARGQTAEAIFSQNTCHDITNEHPPFWVTQCQTRGTQEWWPVCSMERLIAYRNGPPTTSSTQALIRAQRPPLHLDSCAPAPTVAAQNRYSGNYQTPSQSRSRFRRFEQEGITRARFLTDIDAIRISVRNTCCSDGDPRCTRLFDQAIDIRFCEPSPNTNIPDDCLTGGDYATQSREWMAQLNQWQGVGRGVVSRGDTPAGRNEDFPLGGAVISLLPGFIQAETYTSKLQTVAHEFGHMCSQFRRQIQVRDGLPNAARTWIEFHHRRSSDGDAGIGCLVSEDVRRSYQRLFASTVPGGGTDEMLSCLVANAFLGDFTRFGTRALCPGGCPRAQLEESFAEWILFLTRERREFSALLERACSNYLRDGQHGLPQDSFRCFLRAPRGALKFRELSGCR